MYIPKPRVALSLRVTCHSCFDTSCGFSGCHAKTRRCHRWREEKLSRTERTGGEGTILIVFSVYSTTISFRLLLSVLRSFRVEQFRARAGGTERPSSFANLSSRSIVLCSHKTRNPKPGTASQIFFFHQQTTTLMLFLPPLLFDLGFPCGIDCLCFYSFLLDASVWRNGRRARVA